MKRTLIVVLLALAALTLLVGAAMKSRSIPLQAHIAHYQLTSELERLTADFVTLNELLQTAWRSGQPPGEAAATLQTRITENVGALAASIEAIPAGALERERIDASYSRLSAAITSSATLTGRLITEQSAFSASRNALRTRGNEIAQTLRARGRTRMASDITLLLEDTFAFINPDSSTGEGAIPFLLTTLNRDIRIEANVPAGAASLLTTVESLIAARTDIEIHLDQIGALPIRPNAVSLRQAASDGYQDAVASAERARTFLSGYAVVLLLVIAVIGYRLRNSYRELNLANAELGELNESLEQRVESRTAELTNALTELKESQVQLVQAEKMSSLGQLVAGISHEINTPLLYLANNAELTQERVEIIREFVRASTQALCVSRDDFADSADFQAHLAQSLKRLRRLLLEQELEATVDELGDLNRDSLEGLADLTDMAQSLKDFSRLDRAPVDSFDVNAGIEKTLTIARNIVKHKAEVVKQFGELPAIECSPSKINQVFLNLITNAAQAIEDQGQIVIETRRHDADHVVIAISDNGCGIPPGNLDKICDPFFTTKEVGSGTGLGLSIVDEIVRSHGGELLVESRVGQGSTFSVVLPIRHPAQASEPKVDALLAEAM